MNSISKSSCLSYHLVGLISPCKSYTPACPCFQRWVSVVFFTNFNVQSVGDKIAIDLYVSEPAKKELNRFKSL